MGNWYIYYTNKYREWTFAFGMVLWNIDFATDTYTFEFTGKLYAYLSRFGFSDLKLRLKFTKKYIYKIYII